MHEIMHPKRAIYKKSFFNGIAVIAYFQWNFIVMINILNFVEIILYDSRKFLFILLLNFLAIYDMLCKQYALK